MGGCVSSLMSSRNEASLIDHPEILLKYRKYGQEAYAVPGTEREGYSPIYRFINTSDEEHEKLSKDFYYEYDWVRAIQKRCTEVPDRPALGYREITKIEKRTVTDSAGKEKTLDFYHCAPYKTISYKEMWHRMESFARGLALIGLKRRDNVCIYEDTRWEWFVSIYGIWLQDMLAATVYANLGNDALAYALQETESAAIVCNGAAVANLVKILRSKKLSPKLIYLDALPAGTDTAGFEMYPWSDVVQKGESSDSNLHFPNNADEEALIMYTSGTTGNPKGVVHTHGSIAAGIRSLNHRLLDLYRPNEENEIYCAYLPMAHILEFGVVNIFINRGSTVGFGSPRTLTDAFCIPHGDLREFKPRVIIAVPRVFDTIRKTVESRLPARGTFKRTIFDKAYENRRQALIDGKETPYWNDKVFSPARQILGGNVYGMLSGGGPLSATTQEFINVMCGGPLILQGWGMTETICIGATQRLGDLKPNCVGQVLKTEDLCLKDTEFYKHTDKPEPRGEVCLRGPFLFKGYYKQPELTKEVMDADGWFHTGDVGAIDEKGRLSIVGRVKALAKNANGEYIALENLESIYGQNALSIVNGVCIVVHPDRNYIAALVLTDHKNATAFAKEHNISTPWPELLRDPEFRKAAAESFAMTGKAAGRKSFELPRNVLLLNEEWTPENGLMTPTSKLRRTMIDRHYAKEIEELFAQE